MTRIISLPLTDDDDNVFEIIIEESANPKRSKQDWQRIGLEFYKKKLKSGISAKEFAKTLGIPYGTFTKSMSRYKNDIAFAINIDRIENTPASKLKKADRQKLILQDFRNSVKTAKRNEGAAKNNKSSKWFADTIRDGVKSHKVSKPEPGKLYAFIYDAKHKDTLPVWDKYPLILYLGSGTRGSSFLMYGLNLHYIPVQARIKFLEDLLKVHSSTPRLSNNTRLKVNWSKVKGLRGSDVMIKSYLPNHIKGTFLEINPKDWYNVSLMPTQKFISKGKSFSARKVWSQY